MKQVVLRHGRVSVVELPAPSPQPGRVLISNVASVVSSGTERAIVAPTGEGGSLWRRAVHRPDLVARALQRAREEGIRKTIGVAREVLASDKMLGYSCAGTVLDTGGLPTLRVGDRVAAAGFGYASHAEVVSVPANLVARVPDSVPLRDAAFTTLGAIALQGVRRLTPTLGERVIVVGLGVLGLLTVQILGAAGCPVLTVEPSAGRRRLALDLGAELALEPDAAAAAVYTWTDEFGADGVLVTASGGESTILNRSIELLRPKGRVVVVGAVGMELEREPLYAREADVLISTSYGPGRYDASYEEEGADYPIAYVRWTENRNMGEFLRLLDKGFVRVQPIADLELPLDRAPEAYGALEGDSPPLAPVISYDGVEPELPESVRVGGSPSRPRSGRLRVAIVGPGDFIRATHLPGLLGADGVEVTHVVSRTPSRATDVARQIRGAEAATDWRVAIDSDDVDLVVIGTRHDTHAEIAAAALRAGRSVFVEKPLGLTREQIDGVREAARSNPALAIGFNRRFAPLSARLAADLAQLEGRIHLLYRVNAPLARDHWLNDPVQGGGRLLGEACHMFDYANWLCGPPERVLAAAIPVEAKVPTVQTVTVLISHRDGSLSTVSYSGEGSGVMPKERIEVSRGGSSWVLDDFTELTSFGGRGQQRESLREQDKGHRALLSAVLDAARGRAPYTPDVTDGYLAQSVALGALESLATGASVAVRT